MSTVYLCPSWSQAKNFSEKDIYIFWDADCQAHNLAQSQAQPQAFDLNTWCEEHTALLREDVAALMFSLACTKINKHGKTQRLDQYLALKDSLLPWYTSLLFEKHPHILPEMTVLCKLRALEYILNSLKPAHLRVQIPHLHIQEALREYCAAKGIAFEKVQSASSDLFFAHAKSQKSTRFSQKTLFSSHVTLKHSPLRRLYEALPHLLQAALRFGHWLYAMRPLLWNKPCPQAQAPEQATLVSYFPHVHKDLAKQGCFRSQYWENLHASLENSISQKKIHLHWLYVRVNSAQYSLKQSISLKNNFARKAKEQGRAESFYYVEEFLSLKDIYLALKDFWYIRKKAKTLEPCMPAHCHYPNSPLPLWAFMRQSWRASFGGWRSLERCLQRRAFLAYARTLKYKATPHLWTLFPWENCPWERMLTEAMRTAFPLSPVYAAQHSSLRIADFRYVDGKAFFEHAAHTPLLERTLPQYYCCNGPLALKNLQGLIPQEKIRMVEALRYAYLGSLPSLYSQAPVRNLILITSYFAHETEAQIRTLAQWFTQSSLPAALQPKIYIKPHPHLAVQPFLKKYALPLEAVHILHTPLKKLWEHIQAWQAKGENALFWLANSTTVALEAAHMGLPLCVQRAQDGLNLCPLPQKSVLFWVQDSSTLDTALTKATATQLHEVFFTINAHDTRWKSLLGIA